MRRAVVWSAKRGSPSTGIRPTFQSLAILLVTLLAAGGVAGAQAYGLTPSSDDQPTTIHGTVINAVTHAPVPRALVYSPDNRLAMLTDGEGHFEFSAPKPGTGPESGTFFGQPRQVWSVAGAGGPLWLMARKPGFLDDPADSRQIQATPSGEITIPLMPEAVIKGRVVISESDPASEITVQLFSTQVQEGLPRWVPANAVVANSNGEFRFAELLPGTYKVATNEWMENDPALTVPGGQLYGFPPVYYPGVSDFAAAGTIQLAAGQTVQADLPLTRQPYYPVRIPVANPDLRGGMNITVSVQGHRGPGYSLGYNAEEHRIEGMLPNGHYLVETTSYGENVSAGAVNLAVAGTATQGPSMTLHRASSIEVHVDEEFASRQWNGSGNWMVGGRSFRMRGPRLYLQVRVESEDDFEGARGVSLRPPSGQNDDSLVLENLTPGRYRLRVSTSRGYVAAATMGGVDLLHDALVIGPASNLPIEIKMRDDTAEIEGTVTGISADPAAAPPAMTSAYVYCIPLRDSPGQFQQVAVSQDGKFSLESMAPGAYRVLAFKSPQPHLPYGDADAMQPYDSKGPVVQLSSGQKTTVQVPIITGSE